MPNLLKLFNSSKCCYNKKNFLNNVSFISKRTLSKSTTKFNNSDESVKKSKESPLKHLLDDAATFEDYKPKEREQLWTTLPYPQGTNIRKQGDFFKKTKKDPRDSTIILFPGQGTQYVGMCKDLLKFPMTKDLFELASYILKYDLLKLCLEGPKEKLDDTRYAQPAIVVSSLAAIERLKEERPNAINNCVATAGYSLGELTALIFAGAFEFEKGLKLIQIRAEAMQMASEMNRGGMATVFYAPDSKLNVACKDAKEWATEKGDPFPLCVIGSYLYPDCKVIAGSESALEFLEQNYKNYKLKRVRRLPVSGAFHTDLMNVAQKHFRNALDKIEINEPGVCVYSNFDGKVYRDVEDIRRKLPKQMVKPIKWEQLMHSIYERDPNEYFPNTYECGPGYSLKMILKNVNAKAWNHCHNIEA